MQNETAAARTAGVSHIIAQRAFHDPAFLIGDREGLTRIRDAIDAALETGEGRCGVFAGDGEGYTVHVLWVPEAAMSSVPFGYTDTALCGSGGAWTEAMIRSVRHVRG